MNIAIYDHTTIIDGGPLFLGYQRTFLAIYNDLNALTVAQKNNIWTAFVAGTPPLWSRDEGAHAGTVMACAGLAIDMAISAGFTAADQTRARLRMVAAYLVDNPTWLTQPAFDPSIDVRPYAAAP